MLRRKATVIPLPETVTGQNILRQKQSADLELIAK